MPVAVADARAVDEHDVVEQGARAFLNRLHFAQQVGQLLHVECVNLLDLFLFLLVPGVMR